MSGEETLRLALRRLWERTLSLPSADRGDPTATIQTEVATGSDRVSTPPRPRVIGGEEGGPAEGLDYQLIDLIGRGGMGVVFAARQSGIERRVAIKLMHQNRLGSRHARERFAAEARVTGSLEHPNIVPVYEFGAADQDRLFYTMRRIEGSDWSSRLRTQSLDERLTTWMRVADAIGFAHAHGVIHCDLKPANVVLGDYGEVLVVDWGLALLCDEGGLRPAGASGTVGGTPAYMPPELARAEVAAIGFATDVYLLGALLFELATGGPPHEGTEAASVLSAAADNRIRTVERTPLIDIALKAMVTDPAARPAGVAALQERVRAWQSHRQAELLAERARELLRQAERTRRDEDYADALFTWEEARSLWPDCPGDTDGPDAVRLHWAEAASDRGNHVLVRDLADGRGGRFSDLDARAARAILAAERRSRWRRILLAAAMVLLVAIGAITAGGLVVVDEQRREALAEEQAAAVARSEASASAEEASIARRAVERSAYAAAIRSAWSHWNAGRGRAALVALASCPPDQRGWEWRVLAEHADGDSQAVPIGEERPLDVRFDADARYLALAHRSGRIVFRDTGDLRIVGERDLGGVARRLFPLPDGRMLALQRNAAIVVSAVHPGVLRFPLPGLEKGDWQAAAAIGPDRVVVGHRSGAVLELDLATGWTRAWPALPGRVGQLVVGEGWCLAAVGETVWWRELDHGLPPLKSGGFWQALEFPYSGAVKAVAVHRGTTVAWIEHVQRGGELVSLHDRRRDLWVMRTPVRDIRYSADGSVAIGQEVGAGILGLFENDKAGKARYWFSREGNAAQDLSADGSLLAIVNDGTLRLLRSPLASGIHIGGVGNSTNELHFQSGSTSATRRLTVGTAGGLIYAIDFPSLTDTEILREQETGFLRSWGASPNSARDIITAPAADDGKEGPSTWILDGQGVHAVVQGELQSVDNLAGDWLCGDLHSTDDLAALGNKEGEIVLVDSDGIVSRLKVGDGRGSMVRDLCLNAKGNGLFAIIGKNQIVAFDIGPDGMVERWKFAFPAHLGGLALAPDGSVILGNAQRLVVLAPDDGSLIHQVGVPGDLVNVLEIIDGGRRLVVGTQSGWLTVLRVDDWEPLASWRSAPGAIEALLYYEPWDLLIVGSRQAGLVFWGPGPVPDRP